MDFSLLQNAQIDLGAHPASYSTGIGVIFWVKSPGLDVGHPPPCSAEGILDAASLRSIRVQFSIIIPQDSTFVQNLSLRLAGRSNFNFPLVSLRSSLTQHTVFIPRIAL